MSIGINMWSNKTGKIKSFLESYFQEKIEIDEDTGKWFFECEEPLESVDIISAAMDNSEKYDLALYIRIPGGDIYRITEENYNDVIKGLFILFYKETSSSKTNKSLY